ncbi:MAG: squalene/phytoene synthase family protein [Parvularculaceae bacterium]|nr:squalene/phytoene synthase family protein [Parvularculaceae bacterium]
MTASATALDTRDAAREATEKVKKSGTSFAAGMAILPKPRREAMHAIYAFCREVDDIADDERLGAAEKRARLAEWRREIDRLYEGRPAMSVGVALLEPVRAYNLPKNEFLMMIEGMEMDAEGPIVAPSFERLFAYTRRVAGAVGLLSMPVFGAPKGAASDRFALALGDALQLTNILRDVAEDAKIGRLYLPKELLEKYGAPVEAASYSPPPVGEGLGERVPASPLKRHTIDGSLSPGPSPTGGGVKEVASDLAMTAREKFTEARAALAALDWRTVRPALLMMGAYEAYLRKLTARGWDRVGEPVSLSKAEKLFIAARYGFAPPLISVHR